MSRKVSLDVSVAISTTIRSTERARLTIPMLTLTCFILLGLEFTKIIANYSPTAAAIREDIQRMLDFGVASTSQSRQRTPDLADNDSPESVISAEAAKHKFSRHNPVVSAGIEDGGADLGLRSASSILSPSGRHQAHTGSANAQNVQSSEQPLDENSTDQQPSLHQHLTYDSLTDPLNATAFHTWSNSQNLSHQNGESHDWLWNLGMPSGDDLDLDHFFDPIWRVQNQWDMDMYLPNGVS